MVGAKKEWTVALFCIGGMCRTRVCRNMETRASSISHFSLNTTRSDALQENTIQLNPLGSTGVSVSWPNHSTCHFALVVARDLWV